MTSSDPLSGFRSEWLDVVQAVSADAMTGIDDWTKMPNAVFFQSELWEKLIFRKALGFHRTKAKVERSYQLAEDGKYDLLLHRYSVKFKPGKDAEGFDPGERIAVKVAVTESSFALHVRFFEISHPDYWGKELLERATSLAEAFLDLPEREEPAGDTEEAEEESRFKDIPGAAGARAFSTDFSINLTALDEWNLRVDGVETSDALALICYKRHPKYDSFIPPKKWFDEEFRALSAAGA